MSDRRAAFFEHTQQIQEHLSLTLSETDTRVYLIDPVLRILGYVRPSDVRREVPVPATKEFLDYELYADNRAQAIVEAKALRFPVTDQAAAQCVQYAAVLGVRWCIITNGVTWAIYNAHATGPLVDKKVALVRLDGDEAAVLEAWDVLSLFARESLVQASPLSQLLAERAIADELSRPDSAAVSALRKAIRDRFGERVSPQVVVDAIRRLQSRFAVAVPGDAPDTAEATTTPSPVSLATPQPVGGDVNSRSEAAHRAWETRRAGSVADSADTPELAERHRAARTEVVKPDGTRVALPDLVAAGLIPADALMQLEESGVTHLGRISNGKVEVNGALYANLSSAAMALRSGKSSNGWLWWTYQGRPLAEIRQELVQQYAAASESQTS